MRLWPQPLPLHVSVGCGGGGVGSPLPTRQQARMLAGSTGSLQPQLSDHSLAIVYSLGVGVRRQADCPAQPTRLHALMRCLLVGGVMPRRLYDAHSHIVTIAFCRLFVCLGSLLPRRFLLWRQWQGSHGLRVERREYPPRFGARTTS